MSYTNITSKEGKTIGVTVQCDHKGCKVTQKGEKRVALSDYVEKQLGWMCKSASEHYCPTHKVEHGARVPKAAKPVNKKADGKTAKTATKKAAKPVVKPAGKKVNSGVQPVVVAGGQSIGKMARSAKK